LNRMCGSGKVWSKPGTRRSVPMQVAVNRMVDR
jgi:hypothetical protein